MAKNNPRSLNIPSGGNLPSAVNAIISTTDTLPTTVSTTNSLTIYVTDINGNYMADGTTVSLSATGGTVDPDSINLAARQTEFVINYTSGDSSGTETLTIEVTSSPSGLVSTASMNTVIP